MAGAHSETMGLFGLSKKERDLKALSEKEIQLRLYGHLRAPHAASHDRGAIASNRPIRPVILGPQVRSFEDRKNIPPQITSAEPVSSQTRSSSAVKTSKTGESEDLFSTSAGETAKTKPSAHEIPRVTKHAPHSRTPELRQEPSRPNLFVKALDFIAAKLFPFLGRVVKNLFVFIFQLIAALLGYLSSFILKIDFKNPKVRRIFSWTLGVGVLVFLLVGIHILNLKREIAMRHPKKVSISKVSPKKVKDVIPQQVAAQTIAGDSLPESVLNPVEKNSHSVISQVSDADSSHSEILDETVSLQKGQVIQIATFATLSDADKLVSKLKQSGWPCFAKPLVRSGGKTYFCVFLGAFKTYQEAEIKLAEFKKKEISKPFQDAFIRSL